MEYIPGNFFYISMDSKLVSFVQFLACLVDDCIYLFNNMNDGNVTEDVGGGLTSLFVHIVSIPNLLRAWREFKKGKVKKKDVSSFELRLEDNIFTLHEDLISGSFNHAAYQEFYVSDPKRRHIHKAVVRDRVVHQALYRILYPLFDKHFIYDSYSSRKNRGTHIGVERAFKACRKASKNWKKKVYVLKCDIRKFFDSIDHSVLRALIEKRVWCADTMHLVDLLFASFEKEKGKGLPLGNVTSQLFSNIYLNELDQFVKHQLKMKYYFRYCDDFIIISESRDTLLEIIRKIKIFLQENLKLDLHPHKVEIRSVRQGIDFLGYVILPHLVVLRTRTKRRIIRKIKMIYTNVQEGVISKETFHGVLTSYLGVVSHARVKEMEFFIRRFLY